MKRLAIAVTLLAGALAVASGTALLQQRDARTEANVEAIAENDAVALRSEVPSSVRTELDASNRVRPIYAGVLSRIRSHLGAEIAESGDSRITVDLPDLPENLYGDRYSGTVTFGTAVVWTVEIFAPRPADLQSPPTLTLRFDDPTDLQEGPRLILSLDTGAREIVVIATNGAAPSAEPLPTVIPGADPDAAIARLTRSIVEGQLLAMGSVDR